jgi:hypothetical protein
MSVRGIGGAAKPNAVDLPLRYCQGQGYYLPHGACVAEWMSMKIDRRCHCGKITYEAEIDPDAVSVCRCTDCQRLAGSAFRVNVPAAANRFKLCGELMSYIKIKTADSGNLRRHTFCGDCGTPICSCAVENPESYARVGAITQRARLVPHRQQWRRSALAWVDNLAAMSAKGGTLTR